MSKKIFQHYSPYENKENDIRMEHLQEEKSERYKNDPLLLYTDRAFTAGLEVGARKIHNEREALKLLLWQLESMLMDAQDHGKILNEVRKARVSLG